MIDALAEPFSQGIGQRALVETIVLGAVCGPLGVWVVLYRQSYAAESLAHGMLPGLVVATLAGIPLGLGAAGGLLLTAASVSLAGRERTVGVDAAVAVTVTTLFGAGALLALSPDVPARLGELLFGDPLSISTADLAGSAALAIAVLAGLYALHRGLTTAGFDAHSARSLGASPENAGLALLVLLALTTLVAVQALGNLLVVALIIAPAAAALRLAARLGPALCIATGLGIAAGVGGLYISHYLELAAGASIALVAILLFAISLPFGHWRPRPAGDAGRSAVEAIGVAR
jgi:ABC-type Mn2+/Zn2+ transport system permease subunit